ncbi:unnamed protein product, partial [Rotaria sp. Silwood1]
QLAVGYVLSLEFSIYPTYLYSLIGGDRGSDYRSGGGGEYRGSGRGASHGSSRDNRSNPY